LEEGCGAQREEPARRVYLPAFGDDDLQLAGIRALSRARRDLSDELARVTGAKDERCSQRVDRQRLVPHRGGPFVVEPVPAENGLHGFGLQRRRGRQRVYLQSWQARNPETDCSQFPRLQGHCDAASLGVARDESQFLAGPLFQEVDKPRPRHPKTALKGYIGAVALGLVQANSKFGSLAGLGRAVPARGQVVTRGFHRTDDGASRPF